MRPLCVVVVVSALLCSTVVASHGNSGPITSLTDSPRASGSIPGSAALHTSNGGATRHVVESPPDHGLVHEAFSAGTAMEDQPALVAGTGGSGGRRVGVGGRRGLAASGEQAQAKVTCSVIGPTVPHCNKCSLAGGRPGTSIAAYGTLLAVGAPNGPDGEKEQQGGSVLVYGPGGAHGEMAQVARVDAPTAAVAPGLCDGHVDELRSFGLGVAMSSAGMAVWSNCFKVGGLSTIVLVYEQVAVSSGSQTELQWTLISPLAAPGNRSFGLPMAMQEDVLVLLAVSAQLDQPDEIVVYAKGKAGWSQRSVTALPTGESCQSISMFSPRIAVLAYNLDSNTFATYIYKSVQQTQLVLADTIADQRGNTGEVSIGDTTLAVSLIPDQNKSSSTALFSRLGGGEKWTKAGSDILGKLGSVTGQPVTVSGSVSVEGNSAVFGIGYKTGTGNKVQPRAAFSMSQHSADSAWKLAHKYPVLESDIDPSALEVWFSVVRQTADMLVVSTCGTDSTDGNSCRVFVYPLAGCPMTVVTTILIAAAALIFVLAIGIVWHSRCKQASAAASERGSLLASKKEASHAAT